MKGLSAFSFQISSVKRGTVLILTFIIMIALVSVTSVFLFMISVQLRGSSADKQSTGSFWLSEAGTQYGCWAAREDTTASYQTGDPAANGYSDAVYLEGYESYGLGSQYGSNYDRASFHGTSFTNSTVYYATLKNKTDAELQIWDFQQRYNLIGTRIKNLEIVLRAGKNASGGTDPIIQLQYTINGSNPSPTWVDIGSPISIDNTTAGPESYRYVDMPTPASWSYFVDSDDTRIRALRTNAGNRHCLIDWLALRAVVEVDALTEPWGSGSYETFPYILGDGTIESVTITDESSKVHLNYAPQLLLQYLAEECGYTVGEATVFAQRVVKYREGDDSQPGVAGFDDDGNGTVDDARELFWSGSDDNPFNTIDEMMEIQDMNQSYYDMVEDYVTVHSWVNNQAARPGTASVPEARAPVNINTADARVLRAIFRTRLTSAEATALANYVVTQRATSPFTHMCSTYSYQQGDSKSFLVYVDSLVGGSLSDARVLDVAEISDASVNNFTLAATWDAADPDNNDATDICYYTNTFLITAVGSNGVIQRTVRTTYGESYDYTNFSLSSTGTFALPTYYTYALVAFTAETPHAYWGEI